MILSIKSKIGFMDIGKNIDDVFALDEEVRNFLK